MQLGPSFSLFTDNKTSREPTGDALHVITSIETREGLYFPALLNNSAKSMITSNGEALRENIKIKSKRPAHPCKQITAKKLAKLYNMKSARSKILLRPHESIF